MLSLQAITRHRFIKRLPSLNHPLAQLLFIIVAALMAYSGTTKCGFIGLDDDLYVYENAIIRQGLSGQGVRWAFSAFFASTWQPLVWLSYMLDISLSGVNPAALHRTNLLLHLINIALVYACLQKITKANGIAFFTSLLFAIHPVHVESVVWIAGRKDLLSTPFWWGAILAYVTYARSSSRLRIGVVCAVMALGLMAKPMLMTLPVVLLALDIWPLQRASLSEAQDWRSRIIEKWPLFLMSIASFFVTLHVQTTGGSILGLDTISIWGRASNAVVSLWRYLGKLLWPTRLAILYPHPGNWPFGITLAALIGTSIAVILAWRQRNKHPAVIVGLIGFLIPLIPVLGLIQFGWHAMADRFLYIPAIPCYAAVAYIIHTGWRVSTRWRPPLAMLLLGITLALVAQTHRQVSYWQNSLTLFTHAVSVTHDNWMMHNGVGAALSRAGRNDEAAPHFEAAIRLKPDRPKAHFNLGHVRFMQGRWADAIAHFQRSIELFPTDQALYNLAAAQRRNSQLAEAESTYLSLLKRTPQHIPAMIALGDLYRTTDRSQLAIERYQQALALDNGNSRAQTGLGIALLDHGQPVEALKNLVNVLQVDPNNAEARSAVQRAMTPE